MADNDIEFTKLVTEARDRLQRADAMLSTGQKPALSRMQCRMLCAALDETQDYLDNCKRKMPVEL
jgi:hypothetical protein